MEFKSNANYNEEPKTGSIFTLKYNSSRGRKMLIRSQDNKTLFNFTQCINIGEHGKGAVIYVNNYPAGEYSTAEKALKVLDMIQEAYVNGHIDYQMPADSEVEI